jgi:acyl carrier protein
MAHGETYNKAFIETFGVSPEQVPTMQFSANVEWDSVAHMQLIAVLEDSFDIMMEMDDIIEFSSYEKGKEILKKYDITIE